MIAGTKEIKPGTHIWVIFKNTLLLGVLLNYEYLKDNMLLRIIIPISKTKCSYIIRERKDPCIFSFKDKEQAEMFLSKCQEQIQGVKKKKYKIIWSKKI